MNLRRIATVALLAGALAAWVPAVLPAGEAWAQGGPPCPNPPCNQQSKKVDISRQTNLDFFRATQNQGLVSKNATASMVAKFLIEVRLQKNKTTDLQVDVMPEDLTNGDGDAVPYSNPAVAYRLRQDDPSTATQKSTSFTVTLPQSAGGGKPETIDVYLYIYGGATVGDVPTGPYESVLTVDATRIK